jgi:hypothetical protein
MSGWCRLKTKDTYYVVHTSTTHLSAPSRKNNLLVCPFFNTKLNFYTERSIIPTQDGVVFSNQQREKRHASSSAELAGQKLRTSLMLAAQFVLLIPAGSVILSSLLLDMLYCTISKAAVPSKTN